jgi:hypothetical protein
MTRNDLPDTQHATATPEKLPVERPPLAPIQETIITMLCAGKPLTHISRDLKVHRTTIYRWMEKNEAFLNAVEFARDTAELNLNEDIVDLTNISLRTVRDLLESPNTGPALRLRTALAVLNRSARSLHGWHLPSTRNHMPWDEFAHVFDNLCVERNARNRKKGWVKHDAAPDPKPPTRAA